MRKLSPTKQALFMAVSNLLLCAFLALMFFGMDAISGGTASWEGFLRWFKTMFYVFGLIGMYCAVFILFGFFKEYEFGFGAGAHIGMYVIYKILTSFGISASDGVLLVLSMIITLLIEWIIYDKSFKGRTS